MTFQFYGVPVEIHWTTLLIFFVFVWDAKTYIGKTKHGSTPENVVTAAFIASAIVLISVAIHELSHGLVSTYFGNPIVNSGFNGLGAFVQPKYNLTDTNWHQEVLVALAGPGANILIALIAAAYVYLTPESLHENTVQYIGYLNIKLARFNLMPIFILDGSKVLHGLLWPIIGTTFADYAVIAAGVLCFYWLWNKKRGHPEIEDHFMKL